MALDVLVFEQPMSKAIGLQLNNKRKKSQDVLNKVKRILITAHLMDLEPITFGLL